MLKHLIANGRISGYMSEIKENHERRIVSVHKQTMGNLVGQFIENTFIGIEKSAEPAIDRKNLISLLHLTSKLIPISTRYFK